VRDRAAFVSQLQSLLRDLGPERRHQAAEFIAAKSSSKSRG